MRNIMQNEAFNGLGWLSTFLAAWLNGLGWLMNVSFNQALTVVISLLSAIFLLMKIYDQYLITKNRKQKNLNNDSD